MAKIRYAILCSLLFLPTLALFAWSQRESRSTRTPQVQIDLTVGTLNLTTREKEQFQKETGIASVKVQNGQPGVWKGMTGEGDTIMALVQRMRDRNAAKLLACPKMVTQEGRPAMFLSGGQLPVFEAADATGEKAKVAQLVEFGHKCTFLPTITENGKIRVKMEFSQIEPGLKAPSSFSETKFNATAELEKGKTVFFLTPKIGKAENNETDGRREYLLYMITAEIVSK